MALGTPKAITEAMGTRNHVSKGLIMNEINWDGFHSLPATLATIPAGQSSDGQLSWFPAVDILEDINEYLFKIDLPDVRPEAIHIAFEQNELVISGERPVPALEGKECLRVERPHGYFERRFFLPPDASHLEVDNLFRESVLELHVRKLAPGPQNLSPPSVPSKLKLRSKSETVLETAE